MNEIYENLKGVLTKANLKSSFTDAKHIIELKDEITNLHKQNIISDALYDRYLYNFQFNCDEFFPTAKTIITIAMSSPISKINFNWKGQNYKLTVPPQYLYHETDEITKTMEDFFKKHDGKAMEVKLPLKLLAAKTGISKYGRNNISYTNEFGSFYRILAFLTDLPCDEDNWQAAERMDSCNNCSACANVCPTGAISKNRNIIRGEKCLTFINESKNSFPKWIENSWHNSIIGCIKCQTICPQNKEHLNNVNEYYDVFTPEDIEAIISYTPFHKLSNKLKNTLDKLSLADYYFDGYVLGRNIKALIDNA